MHNMSKMLSWTRSLCRAQGTSGTARTRVSTIPATPKNKTISEPAEENVLKGLTHSFSTLTSDKDTVAPGDIDTTKFDYLFDDIVTNADKHLPAVDPATIINALKELGRSMVEPPSEPEVNSPIPPIYTYWGQFVDHDTTANTDRNAGANDITVPDFKPLDPESVKKNLKNLRQPALNLDHVYGDGPFVHKDPAGEEFIPYDGIKLQLGEEGPLPGGAKIPRFDDRGRDLPRRQGDKDPERNGVALIGDARNDENLIVAQLHVAFLRFHNATVDWVRKNQPELDSDEKVFQRARDLTRWSYQWSVVNDYLKTVALGQVVDSVLQNPNGNLLRLKERGTYMPLEFSVAAFRFGHSMVRPQYDWNRNFGLHEGNVPGTFPFATLQLLFRFTGKPKADIRLNPLAAANLPTGGKKFTFLPANWPAEWDRMVDKESSLPDRFARKIDTKVAPPLADLFNEGIDVPMPLNELFKQLAVRNLLRGYLLSLPTGQAVAAELGIQALTRDELEDGSSNEAKKALTDGGFFDRTPLWFYILKESEVRAKGSSLGEVGSRIVAETIIGQILNDSESYLNQKDWNPEQGVKLPNGTPVTSIKNFLQFAGVLDPAL